MVVVASEAWGDAERQLLRDVRTAAGQTQADCATVLRTQFGVSSASQPNVNRWESGKINRPRCVEALLAYCDSNRGVGTVAGPAAISDQVPMDFRRLTGEIVGEPLLGPRQAALVDALSERLRVGPPMSPSDRETYLDQLQIVGLIDRSAH